MVMLGTTARHVVRILAMLALTLQVSLPGLVAVGESRGIDVARYICLAPDAEASPEDVAAARQLAALLGEPVEHSGSDTWGHCPVCSLAQLAPLPTPSTISEPVVHTPAPCGSDFSFPTLTLKATGPPVGTRAPPVFI
mgnify:CR=1 FL=1